MRNTSGRDRRPSLWRPNVQRAQPSVTTPRVLTTLFIVGLIACSASCWIDQARTRMTETQLLRIFEDPNETPERVQLAIHQARVRMVRLAELIDSAKQRGGLTAAASRAALSSASKHITELGN